MAETSVSRKKLEMERPLSDRAPPSVILTARGAHDILGRMSDQATKPARKLIAAQSMDEAKAGANGNDPKRN
jgi:hypothetical protein